MSSVDFFRENKYIVVRNLIPKEFTNVYYEYCKLQTLAIDWKSQNRPHLYNKMWDGRFDDPQCYGVFSKYGDHLMETTLLLKTNEVESLTGLNLLPNYAYWRLYEKGSVLDRHIDRASCEVSATINLGSNVSNVDKSVYPNYEWPIFVKTKEGQELPISLSPGDALIYRGCDIEHWREEFIGLNNAQVFFHWNEKDGEFNKLYDDRPLMGINMKDTPER